MIHQINILTGQKYSVWASVWELALSWWRMIRVWRLVFLTSPKISNNQSFRIGTVAIWMTWSVFQKKQTYICFESKRFCPEQLSWILLALEEQSIAVLFWFGLIRIDTRFVTCHVFSFKAPRSNFFNISLHQLTRVFFWTNIKLNLPDSQNVHANPNIEYILMAIMPNWGNLTVCNDNLALSVHTEHLQKYFLRVRTPFLSSNCMFTFFFIINVIFWYCSA